MIRRSVAALVRRVPFLLATHLLWLGWRGIALPAEVAARVTDTANRTVRLADERLEITFDGETGGLRQMRDVALGHAHLHDEGPPGRELWSLRARRHENREAPDGGSGPSLRITPHDANDFHFVKRGEGAESIRLVWRDFRRATAADLTVEIRVALDRRVPDSRWRFTMRNDGALSVEEIHFPIVAPIARQDDEVLAVPHWMGEKMANPRPFLVGSAGKGRRLEWPYPGHLSLQCVVSVHQGHCVMGARRSG